jgi:hypothetical protein
MPGRQVDLAAVHPVPGAGPDRSGACHASSHWHGNVNHLRIANSGRLASQIFQAYWGGPNLNAHGTSLRLRFLRPQFEPASLPQNQTPRLSWRQPASILIYLAGMR